MGKLQRPRSNRANNENNEEVQKKSNVEPQIGRSYRLFLTFRHQWTYAGGRFFLSSVIQLFVLPASLKPFDSTALKSEPKSLKFLVTKMSIKKMAKKTLNNSPKFGG